MPTGKFQMRSSTVSHTDAAPVTKPSTSIGSSGSSPAADPTNRPEEATTPSPMTTPRIAYLQFQSMRPFVVSVAGFGPLDHWGAGVGWASCPSDRSRHPLLFGGCHVARDTIGAIAGAGLEVTELERHRYAAVGPIGLPAGPHVVGCARSPGAIGTMTR